MTIKDFNFDTDYVLIQSWTEARKIHVLDKSRISDYGLTVCDEDKDIAICFLYPFKGSDWCMFENLISNPDTTREQRNKAIDLLFISLCNKAKDMGYKEIFTTCYLDNVSNRLNNLGFTKGNDKVSHFVGKLV